jgi:hypothetical protein
MDQLTRVLKVAGLSVAVITAGLGVTGCNLLKKVAKSQKHAAIAYHEETGGWGYSFDQLTEDLAKKKATEKCPACTVKLTWNQGCGALAQSTTNSKLMSAATGSTAPPPNPPLGTTANRRAAEPARSSSGPATARSDVAALQTTEILRQTTHSPLLKRVRPPSHSGRHGSQTPL